METHKWRCRIAPGDQKDEEQWMKPGVWSFLLVESSCSAATTARIRRRRDGLPVRMEELDIKRAETRRFNDLETHRENKVL